MFLLHSQLHKIDQFLPKLPENTYKSRFQDNNVDLQSLLNMVSLLTDAPKIEDVLIDFVYTNNGNNTYTITD